VTDPINGDKNHGFVQGYLLYLLAAASEAASAEFHAKVREAGLRVPEWRVLAGLYDQNGRMVTELARISLIEQSRLTHIIIQMEKREFVRRKSDLKDGRKVRVYLTEKGRELANQLVEQARTHEKNLLKALEEGDGARLKPALRALLVKLEANSS